MDRVFGELDWNVNGIEQAVYGGKGIPRTKKCSVENLWKQDVFLLANSLASFTEAFYSF
jgi:hypothetical protein